MTRSLRAAGFTALLLAVAALAFGPLTTAGFVGEDLPHLVRASPARAGAGASANRAEMAEKLAQGDGPLARVSLRLSHRLWADAGTWGERSAVGVRVENLLLLLGAAAFMRLALRRSLAPWAGMDGARAAAGACALFLACHPLAVAAIASARARGDLLALCLGAAAAASFLRGRQEREPPWTIATGLCVLAAGHASSVALLVPPLLAGLELFSARRGRPMSVRMRTAATTLLVFGALACLEVLTGPVLGSPALLLRTVRAVSELCAGSGAGECLRAAGRDLGVIAIPVPQTVLPGGTGLRALEYGIAGAVLLALLQPALVAARSAPRLWGWLAVSTAAGLLLALALRAAADGDPGSPTSAIGLLPAAAVASVVLAVASTSLSGARRVLLPSALAASFVLFARGSASPWIEASRPLAALRAELADARAQHGPASRWFLVDPPGRVAGLEVAGPYLALLLHPSLSATAEASDSGSLHGISREALYALAREPEFAAMREAGLVLLLPPAFLDDRSATRTALALSLPRPGTGSLAWQEDLRSPLFDVDPWEKRALRVVALPGVSTAQAPRMGWRAGEASTGSRAGVWVQGRDAPTAIFDLSRDPDWLFGERVHRAWLEPEIGRIASAELARDVPSLPGIVEPEVREGTWIFRLDPAAWPRPVHGEARLVLGLLDLSSFRHVEIAAPIPGDRAGVEAVFALSTDFPTGTVRGSPPRAWSLEWRAGDACIARACGRR